MKILCQGREDNPVHTDAFNVLIKNLKEKIQYGVGPLLIVNVQLQVTRTLFMEENSDEDCLN